MNIALWSTLIGALVGAWSSPTDLKLGDLDGLPEWSRPALASLDILEPPEHAGAWRLLDRISVHYEGDGTILRKRRIVQVVLQHRGAEEASLYHLSQLGEGTRIERLRGWHVRPHGRVERLVQNNVMTVGAMATSRALLAGEATVARFNAVTRGSVVIFESIEREKSYLGPSFMWRIDAGFPTRELMIRIVESEASPAPPVDLIPLNIKAWGLQASKGARWLKVNDIPGVGDEALAAAEPSYYPAVIVRFKDRAVDGGRYQSWDHMARWYWSVFAEMALTKAPATLPAATADGDGVANTVAAVIDRLTYRQVYLSHARGWEPLAGEEVARRAYGDCKDMVACLAEFGRQRDIRVEPVLANIVDGPRIGPDDPPYPYFNHLIAAIPLQESLGLPAEVVVDGDRYLIVDPTAKDTPFGRLPAGYRDRAVMICTQGGARWVAIPETALEEIAFSIALQGSLDADLGLTGVLSITETGNVHGMRTMTRRTHQTRIARYLRGLLKLPPLATLAPMDHQLDEKARVVTRWHVNWPLFLRPDADGFRLPDSFLPPQLPPPVTPGTVRQSPLQIDGVHRQTMQLDVQLARPLVPVQSDVRHQGDFWSLTWKASGGKRLQIQQTLAIQSRTFDRTNLVTGVQQVRQLRQDLEQMHLYDSLLRVPRSKP